MQSKLEGTYLGKQLQTHEPQGGQFVLDEDEEPTVVGTAERQQVPRLPPESPFANDPVPTEPPLPGGGNA